MSKIRQMSALVLTILILLSLAGCMRLFGEDMLEITAETAVEAFSDDEESPLANIPDSGGWYYDVENVVLYLSAYGSLPANYITKNEAADLGWSGGSVENYLEGAAIGGDRFGNREGLLPKADGRTYTECDIDTAGASSRGAKRLVFSNDGLYFYTEDHYNSFAEILIKEDGTLEWK